MALLVLLLKQTDKQSEFYFCYEAMLLFLFCLKSCQSVFVPEVFEMNQSLFLLCMVRTRCGEKQGCDLFLILNVLNVILNVISVKVLRKFSFE